VTDTNATINVAYTGILPDLFREGQGVVTEGYLGPDGTFQADTVLARHDENYMPTEVAESLRAQGVWQGDGSGDAQHPPADPPALNAY
jgi:cytochrome c-type biogenesis protein CcmE